MIFSGTKGLTATCMLMLVDRGQLDLEKPVAHYWPEFAANGKERLLVRDIVSHHSGLPGITQASLEHRRPCRRPGHGGAARRASRCRRTPTPIAAITR